MLVGFVPPISVCICEMDSVVPGVVGSTIFNYIHVNFVCARFLHRVRWPPYIIATDLQTVKKTGSQ
jgi:hypothetical protein